MEYVMIIFYVIILVFTEKSNLTFLKSRIYKSNNVFYIGENKFIRTNPLWVIREDDKVGSILRIDR